MKGKKVRRCFENSMEMYKIQFNIRYNCFSIKQLKIMFLTEKDNVRGDSINQH